MLRVLTTALAAALVGTSCSGPRGVAEAPREAAVERRAVEDVFLLTGEIEAVRSAQITAPMLEQPQIRWLADDGAAVAEGDLVVEFDSASVLANLEEQRTRLVQADIQLESKDRELAAETDKRRATLEKAEVEVKKARVDAAVPEELRSTLEFRKMQTTLLERETAFAKARLDLESFGVGARADLVGLRGEVEKARRQLKTAEEGLRSASVRAPRAGVFIVARHWRREEDRKFQAGDNTWPGFPVASIPDPAASEVDARLSEVDHGRIAVGMKARVVLDTWPERAFEGEVASVGSVADDSPERPGFPVRVSLAHPDPSLMRPGLSARVEVVRGMWPGALTVPRAAVRRAEGRTLVQRAGHSETEPLELTACTPLLCVVASGLKEGDRVRLF
jgi:multidrug efflux pump subunit AcrA (membrane-fusion protein)